MSTSLILGEFSGGLQILLEELLERIDELISVKKEFQEKLYSWREEISQQEKDLDESGFLVEKECLIQKALSLARDRSYHGICGFIKELSEEITSYERGFKSFD